jgi:hypothetical protein
VRIGLLVGLLLLQLPLSQPGVSGAQNNFFLIPSPEISLPVAGKLNLHIYEIGADNSPHPATLGAYVPHWMLNGKGELAADPSEGKLTSLDIGSIKEDSDPFVTYATYVAPDKIPSLNPVAIAVELTAPAPGQPRVTLICNVRITEAENHFQIQVPNEKLVAFHQDDSHVATSGALGAYGQAFKSYAQMAMLVEGRSFNIQIAPMTGVAPGDPDGTGTMTVTINGVTPGTYQWKLGDKDGTTVLFNAIGDSGTMVYTSADCVPHVTRDKHCDVVSLKGSTTITSYDSSTGDLMGIFEGTVVRISAESDPPYQAYGAVSGQFHAHVMKMP